VKQSNKVCETKQNMWNTYLTCQVLFSFQKAWCPLDLLHEDFATPISLMQMSHIQLITFIKKITYILEPPHILKIFPNFVIFVICLNLIYTFLTKWNPNNTIFWYTILISRMIIFFEILINVFFFQCILNGWPLVFKNKAN